MRELVAFFIVIFFLMNLELVFGEPFSVSQYGKIEADGEVFVVSYSGTTYVKVFGKVEDSEQGHTILFLMTQPDGSTVELEGRTTNSGFFENQIGFDRNSIKGIYNIVATYDGNTVGEISFQITDKNNPITPKQPEDSIPQPQVISQNLGGENKSSIPSWIKNISGFWANDQISDDEYLTTIKWLIDNGILKVSQSKSEESQSQTKSYEDKGDFKVNIVEPTDSIFKEAYYDDQIKNKGYEEKAKWLNSVFALPEDVTITLTECGEENAFFDTKKKEVVVCYELLWQIDLFSMSMTETFERKADMFNGIGFFVMEHELGHALIDVYDLPITGMEEDAVDQLATILMLKTPESQLYLFDTNIFFAAQGVSETTSGQLLFWDEHSLSLQRYYNSMCLMYGADPEKASGFISSGLLPMERAVRCEDEYKQASHSWERLLEPYASKDFIDFFFQT